MVAQAPSDGEILTARNDLHRGHAGGIELIRRVASRQGRDNAKALNLIFSTHQHLEGNFRTFDPNVMVVDLARARGENLATRLTAVVVEYSLTFREALNIVVGPRRLPLEKQWNHAPAYEEQLDPSVVNWRDSSKPWGVLHSPFASEFMEFSS